VKPKSKKTTNALEYLHKNPGTSAKELAKRFKISLAYAYKLLKTPKVTPGDWKVSAEDLADKPITVSNEPVNAFTPSPGLLTDRGGNYGEYLTNALLSQRLKRTLTDHASDLGKALPEHMWESLDHIATKMARIVNGNCYHRDSWLDIAGYALLIVDHLEALEAKEKTL
jgi:hypothetical protein